MSSTTSLASESRTSQGPVWFYLHGFASSPASSKARAFVDWGNARGLPLSALDLRRPSLAHLRFSEILSYVRSEIDRLGPHARVVLVGSSLGGLAACRVAEVEPRVSALFLMAPAFKLAERWRVHIGEAGWERWKKSDAFDIVDHATGQRAVVDHGFISNLGEHDVADGGFPDIRVPTCIVHGIKDATVDIELSREWAKGKRHVRLVEVDDGHELKDSIPRVISEATEFFRTFGV